jgi:paraquat-inducible protein B
MIWILAFTAITAGIILSYDWYRQHGVEIQITFNDASGLVPGQSKIIYRGVAIGTVREIVLNSDGSPILKARISKRASKMLGKGSKFWIVRPELGLNGVKNLGAISTGNYVAIDPVAGPTTYQFYGLEHEPNEDEDGLHREFLHIVLRAKAVSGISSGTPILYKGLNIGEVTSLSVAKDLRTILIKVIIAKEYKNLIRKSSYFGNVSGFHTSFHLFGGSNIDVDSVKTLLIGGISLFTPNLAVAPARNGDVFNMLTPEEMREND